MARMTRIGWLSIGCGLLWAVLVACQPAPQQAILIPFPTMTSGVVVVGQLPETSIRPAQSDNNGLTNPATAVALVNVLTPTPRYDACPAANDTLNLPEDAPDTMEAFVLTLLGYLSQGGQISKLEDRLRDDWALLDDSGYLRSNVDLTGEGTPEIVIGFRNPDALGTLMILGCREGQYQELYRANADTEETPILIWLGDMNNALPAEIVFARRECAVADACEIATLLMGWNSQQGRFVNLLDEDLLTLDLPAVNDTDNDDVAELLVELENRGTSATGPLRTGLNIYDWNGSAYTLSIIQLDAPRYHIQVIHEADRLLARREFAGAVALYQTALDQEDLRYWFNDGPNTVDSYALYRQILALAALTDAEGLAVVVGQLNTQYPTDEETRVEDLPVYVHMAYVFLNTLLDTDDLHLGCLAALGVADDRDEALELMNRYGSRSPTYTRLDLCPF